ncbi:sodium/calcium exchanger Calx-like isoform X2 [Convolutriloba macropyga]|uniref:sodium/calcium exchanger Calx-like isoform X2 n=1 Tax=Convolutriloba macropyga TaxID=536237 RepID=UPI003F51D5E4
MGVIDIFNNDSECLAYHVHEYKLGYVVECELDGEPYCGDSWILLPAENLWNRWVRGSLYVFALAFLFVGISIVSDIFMQSIEMITSKKRVVKYYDPEAQVMEKKEVLIWNETVANLTLMALGSSAPEIMLSTVETCMNLGKEQKEDGLGVFTIIGSAAFNLLIIISVCISAVGDEPKQIRQFGVFLLTSFWSMFAYIWLLIVLDYITPGEVDWWEALLTLIFFPLLVLSAYYTDLLTARKLKRKKSAFVERRRSSVNPGTLKVGSLTHKNKRSALSALKELTTSAGGGDRNSSIAERGGGGNHSNSVNYATTSFTVKKKQPIESVSEVAQPTAVVPIQEQLKNQAILQWNQLKVFNDRMNKSGNTASRDEKMSQLVQLLALTQDKTDLKRFGSSLKPRVMFLSPLMITQPGESVARIEVIITHVPEIANPETKIQTKDDMYLIESDVTSNGMANGLANGTTSCSEYSTPSLRRIKKTPRLSVTAIDSAYGSTSSMTANASTRRPRLTEKGGMEHTSEDESVNKNKDETELTVKFETRDASAKSGVHYQTTQGELSFSFEKRLQIIEVPLMDNYLSSAIEREIFVVLHSPSKQVELGKTSIIRVTILPNVEAEVGFERDIYYLASKESKQVSITIQRYEALETRVSVEYSTELDSAHGGSSLESSDYVSTSGMVVFEQQETSKDITIPCKATHKKGFYVVLKNPIKCRVSPQFGMTQVKLCVEEEDDDAADDVIGASSDATSRVLKVVGMSGGSGEDGEGAENAWIQQIKESFQFGDYGNSDDDGDEEERLGFLDYLGQFLAFMWKVLFAIVIPPASYLGGTLTFWMALAAIGALVFVVEELGNLLGCVVGLENAITGITIIALGTSLPDTFASRTAALNEQYADASIGNVTGSNSVNVFLGLGVPWVISAVYNLFTTGQSYKVKTSNLSFSVTAFLIVGVVCLGIIIARRFVMGGELGGKKLARWGSSALLLILWLGYTTICSLKALQYF